MMCVLCVMSFFLIHDEIELVHFNGGKTPLFKYRGPCIARARGGLPPVAFCF